MTKVPAAPFPNGEKARGGRDEATAVVLETPVVCLQYRPGEVARGTTMSSTSPLAGHQGNPHMRLTPVKIAVLDGDLVVTPPEGTRERIVHRRSGVDQVDRAR